MPTLPSSHPKNKSRKRKHKQEEEEEETNDGDSQVQGDEDDTTEDGASTSSDYKTPRKKRKNENIRMDATFMKGVGGVILMTNKQKVNALQHTIQDMCEWKGSGFPGKILTLNQS